MDTSRCEVTHSWIAMRSAVCESVEKTLKFLGAEPKKT